MRAATPYYCIAMACELWFERRDFDAFQRSGPSAFSKFMPRPFVRGRDRARVLCLQAECAKGFICLRERERHEDVEGPDGPPVAGMGSGRCDGFSQRDGVRRTRAAGAMGI